MRGTPSLYFKSLNREFHMVGVDRQLFFLNVGLCTPIAFAAQFSPLMLIISGVLFLIGHVIGILITRADAQMVTLFQNQLRYRKYYAANPGIHAKVSVVKPSVIFYVGKTGLV